MYDQNRLDEISDDCDDSPSAVMTLEPDTAAVEAVEWPGPWCEKCEAPLKSGIVAICRNCGWYASLGTFVEVDPSYEMNEEEDQRAQSPQPSHLRVWLDLLPRWSWIIIASVLGIVVESVFARLITAPESGLRTVWSLTQLAAGVSAFIGCHLFNFLVLAADDAEFGVLDLALRPVKLWIRAVQNLPTRLWVANSAACGLAAAAMSLLVIGGIPYERLWDWGFQQPVKQELMGAVMDRVKKLDSRNGADNLEDAIGDFAGTQDDLMEPPQPSQPAKPRRKADCVILGYLLDREGRLDVLVLGTNHLGKLVFAGRVKPKMSDEESAALVESLARIKATQPLIAIQSDTATWVKPKYMCRVTYEQRKKGRLLEVQWERMLGTMDTQ